MKHYAFSDIHGSGQLFDAMVEYMNMTGDDWRCWFLGDACDHNTDGYRIIKRLLNDLHFVYLKGNHEDLFARAADALHYAAKEEQLSIPDFLETNSLSPEDLSYIDDDISLYYYNGGFPIFKAWINDGAPRGLVHQLEDLPIIATYDKYDICHAGCLQAQWDKQDESMLLWNRGHFHSDEEWMPGRILLHGHTPVRNICKSRNLNAPADRPLVYANDTKIGLDTGVVTTGVACLYNLDNHTVIPFQR